MADDLRVELDEIKPCPFCGGSEFVERSSDSRSVSCAKCFWPTRLPLDVWNRRAALPVAGEPTPQENGDLIAQMVAERGELAAKLHYALNGECPAYPGLPSACDPMMCDCLSAFQDSTLAEMVDAACKRLAVYRAASPAREALPAPAPTRDTPQRVEVEAARRGDKYGFEAHDDVELRRLAEGAPFLREHRFVLQRIAARLAATPAVPEAPKVTELHTGFNPHGALSREVFEAIQRPEVQAAIRRAVDPAVPPSDALQALECLETLSHDDNCALMAEGSHPTARCDCCLRFALADIRYALTARAAVPEAETAASRDVLAERKRQKAELGWSEAHDDAHERGELARAACAFIAGATGVRMMDQDGDVEMWKSRRTDRTPREKLVRAAALILAEIERRDRSAVAPATPATEEGK